MTEKLPEGLTCPAPLASCQGRWRRKLALITDEDREGFDLPRIGAVAWEACIAGAVEAAFEAGEDRALVPDLAAMIRAPADCLDAGGDPASVSPATSQRTLMSSRVIVCMM